MASTRPGSTRVSNGSKRLRRCSPAAQRGFTSSLHASGGTPRNASAFATVVGTTGFRNPARSRNSSIPVEHTACACAFPAGSRAATHGLCSSM